MIRIESLSKQYGGRTVVEGPWGAPPARTAPSASAMAAQMELDDLLDKISASGMESHG